MKAIKEIDYILYDGTNMKAVQDFLYTLFPDRPENREVQEVTGEVVMADWSTYRAVTKVLKIDTEDKSLCLVQGDYLICTPIPEQKLLTMPKDVFDKEYKAKDNDNQCSTCPWYLNGTREIRWPTPGDYPNPITHPVICKATSD